MFARSATIALLALPLLTSAIALSRDTEKSCDTGELKCCNSTQDAKSESLTHLFGLLGINVADVTGLVGLDCSGINVIGVSGNSCTAQSVCCTNNNFSGIVALGCTPVNVNV